MIQVIEGDCLEIIPTLGAVDAVVTDPPYGLEFMGKEWDSFRGSNSGIKKSGYHKLGQHGTPVFDANRRNQKCPRCNKWSYDYPDRKCVCGGALAEGRRLYCTGFQDFCGIWATTVYDILQPGGYLLAFGGTRTYHRMACAIEDAGFVIQDCIMWLYATGFPKGKTQLKPAYEPIVLAYKPGGKRTLSVDECRIPMSTTDAETIAGMGGYGKASFQRQPGVSLNLSVNPMPCQDAAPHTLGRWPANICHDGSEEVLAGFPDVASGTGNKNTGNRDNGFTIGNGLGAGNGDGIGGDSGSAARFFYSSKAGAEDRWGSRHPTVKPVALMKWMVALVTPPGGTVLDPFAGSGTTGVAALATGRNAILIEREAEYVADIRERLAFYEGSGRHSVAAINRNRAEISGTLL